MNYYEYLNKRLETTGGYEYTKSRLEFKNTNPFAYSLFGDKSSVRIDGVSIFTNAFKEDIDKINYDNLASKNDNSEEAPKLNPLEFVLKHFLSIDKIKELADTNKDGEISAEEAKTYIENLAGQDGNADDITLEDFEAILKENNINLEELFENEIEDVETEEVQGDEPVTVENSGAPAATGYAAPATSSGNYGNSAAASAPEVKTIDNMSLEELETEKADRQSVLTEKQNALNAVHNGENEKVKAAKQNADKAKEEYENAIKEDPGAKKFAKQILKNNEKIEKNQQKLDKNAIEINNKEIEISKLETSLEGLRGGLDALTSSLGSLPVPSGKPEDKEKDERIKSKKSELEKEISTKKKEISKQEHELEKLKKDLENLNKEKTKLEKEKQSLYEEKAKLDDLVQKHCTETTKAKLEAFNKAKQNVEEVKAKELETAKSELQAAQESVKEVDTKIAEIKNRPQNFSFENLDIEDIPESVRKQLGAKISILPDGTKVLTFNYTKLDQMQEEFVAKIPEFQRIASEMGFTFVISDGSRSVAESNAARARKGNFVAKGGSSPHNYGVAIDIALYKDGKAVSGNQFKEFANRVKHETGVTWGGDWGSYGQKYETQHFELANWKSKYKNESNLIYNHIA